MIQITMMVWSLIQSQTSWGVKVKWALGSITTNKARVGDGISVDLFQILKHGADKVLHSICQHIWKTQQWPQDWKKSVFIPIPKKGNAKECSSYCTIALISHASKVTPQILQASFQQYMNQGLPDVQDRFRKGRGTRDQIANICQIIKKARVPEKHLLHPPYLPCEKPICGSRSNRTRNRTDQFKTGKGVSQGYIL